MASIPTTTGKVRAGVTEEAKADRWLRCNNGAPSDDVVDSGDEAEEGEGSSRAKAEMARSGRRAAARIAAVEEEAGMGSGGGSAAAVARDVKAEMVARGGGKEPAGAGEKTRSSPRFADRAALGEEIAGGDYLQCGELPRRKRKAIAKHSKPKSPQVYDENQNLRLQLALKTNELDQEKNRRLQLELILKEKEMESLQKKNEELKAENEQLRKNVKPPRVERLCRSCNKYAMHDFRNCPEKRQAASSTEEENGEDSY